MCKNCNIEIKSGNMENHLEICSNHNKNNQNITQKENESNKEKRYQIPFYRAISDKKLRNMLKEKNINSTGNRKLLIKRHREFLLQCTVQQDRTNQLSEDVIAEKVNELFSNHLEKKNKNKKSGNNNFFTSSSSSKLVNGNELFSKLITEIKTRDQIDDIKSPEIDVTTTTISIEKKEEQKVSNNITFIDVSPEILGDDSDAMQEDSITISDSKEFSASPELFSAPQTKILNSSPIFSPSPTDNLTQIPKREQWVSDESLSFSNSSVDESSQNNFNSPKTSPKTILNLSDCSSNELINSTPEFSSSFSSDDKTPPKNSKKRSRKQSSNNTPLRRSTRKRKKLY